MTCMTRNACRRAFADLDSRIAELGGFDGIYARENFDHTPIE
ncbi:hypothetical protein [Pacificispira spongiicola]|nr:hypothetical protein [Pacificispira spongiicola]